MNVNYTEKTTKQELECYDMYLSELENENAKLFEKRQKFVGVETRITNVMFKNLKKKPWFQKNNILKSIANHIG